MIVSHSRKFVFIKCRKTASTSVERFLHPSLAAGDVWTPLSDPPTWGNNYYTFEPMNRLAASSKLLRLIIGRRRFLKKATFSDHTSIVELRQSLGEDSISDYFKFCFDRNPWDFAVSLYFFERFNGRLQNVDFEEFVFTHPIQQNSRLYSTGGKLQVDAVYRYEDLEEKLAELSQRFDLAPAELPLDKAKRRPPGHYREYYSPASRDEIAKRWHDTICLLNYDF